MFPPVDADMCLEECLKAVHKRRDAFRVILLPRLFTPAWSRLFLNFVTLSLSSLLAHPTGLLIYMNPCGLAFLFRL